MVSGTFLGILPHALYLHDHFSQYDRIIGITYLDGKGNEHWLPFVNEQGRMLAPNWGDPFNVGQRRCHTHHQPRPIGGNLP